MTDPIRRLIAVGSTFLLAALLVTVYAELSRPQPEALLPVLSNQTEYCTTCHQGLPEISPSHPVEVFGCVVCHGGERLALNEDLAHSTMRGGNNPSDLAVVQESCGGSSCHSGSDTASSDHIQRVMTSIQTTYAGAIANIRYTFGAQADLTAHLGVFSVTDDHVVSSAAVSGLEAFDPLSETNPFIHQFAENCLTCHVNAEPPQGTAYTRLTGCAACHTPDVESFPEGKVHRLTTAIPYRQCNTCHNRGNYDLRTMSFVERDDQPVSRMEDYYQPIAQFTQCEWTLDCVDCHTGSEAMGDGDIYSNKHDIQYVQCQTCHGTTEELPHSYTIVDENDLALKLAFLNPVTDLNVGDTILVTERGEPLWNTRVLDDGTYQLVGKVTGIPFTFRPVIGTQCEQNPAEQESRYCHECHAVDH